MSVERKRPMQAGALVTLPSVWYVWTIMIKFPLLGWSHDLVHLITSFTRNVVACSLYLELDQWKTRVELLLWYQLFKLSVSITLPHLSVDLTASRIHREGRSWIVTIIDCKALWQGGWCQPSPRYWRKTQEEHQGRAASEIDRKMVSWRPHA